MNKNLLYGALIVIAIIGFTLFWKSSQKSEVVVEPQAPVTENVKPVAKTETASSISNDVNKIEVNSGIDADLKAIDTDIGTL